MSLKLKLTTVALIFFAANASAQAQNRKSMQFMEAFDAGQPQTIILKLYDQSADVICYVLMPERAARKKVDSAWVYDANTIGSISCLKQHQLVIPVEAPGAAGQNIR